MLKFRCQHCGQRIAVPARHLGKLVTCAECGQATHPLAEQLAKAGAAAAPVETAPPAVATALPPPAAPCGNCGQPIGALQSSHSWLGQRVCTPCHHALSAESSHPGPGRATPALVTRVAAPTAAVAAAPAEPTTLPLRERVARTGVIFIVGVVALYGALTLLRDIAGLIAVAAVAILALLALYAVFRGKLGARARADRPAITAP